MPKSKQDTARRTGPLGIVAAFFSPVSRAALRETRAEAMAASERARALVEQVDRDALVADAKNRELDAKLQASAEGGTGTGSVHAEASRSLR